MALEEKKAASGRHQLILQATRGCKQEGRHGEIAGLMLDMCPHPLADSSGVGSRPSHELDPDPRGATGMKSHIQRSSTRQDYPCLCFTATLGDSG